MGDGDENGIREHFIQKSTEPEFIVIAPRGYSKVEIEEIKKQFKQKKVTNSKPNYFID